MYGIELYIIIVAILGILMSSRGEVKSLNLFSSLFAWRFVMGIGKFSGSITELAITFKQESELIT